jgi:spore germination protein KB
VLIGGGVMFIIVMRNIFVLGADVAARNVYPSVKVFQMMPVLSILPLLDINVILSGAIKIGLVLYFEAKMLGDLVGVKDFKVFVLPLAALDVAGSIFVDNNILNQLFVAAKIVTLAYIPILLIIPLIMLTISLVRKKKPRAEQTA